jgi:hypothetical protein
MTEKEYVLQRAAQAWCQPKTKYKVMDVELCYEFAKILHDVIRIERKRSKGNINGEYCLRQRCATRKS